MTRFGSIVSTGCYLPEIRVHNDDLRRRFAHLPDFVDKMEASSGIRCRWNAPETWATSDVALPAARQALERAGKRPEDVDLIILGTDSPDYISPATSVVLQYKLGAVNAGTFDVGCACASFPTALASGAGWIATNPAIKTVLVVGVYLMHKLTSTDDPMVFFYGDGSGAAVLEPASSPGFITSTFRADGSYHDYWGIYSGGTFEPASEESVKAGRTTCTIKNRYPPELNEETWPLIVQKLAKDGGFSVFDVDCFIFTQVRKPTIQRVMEYLGAPPERAHTIMEQYGYTGSACVAMALDHAIEQGKVKPGDLVVLVGSGVGYNQAGCAFRMP